MFRKKSVYPKNGEVIDDEWTFFCSELVAKTYKEMGILSAEMSSGTYLPASFCMKKALNLINGATLGEELLIDTNL